MNVTELEKLNKIQLITAPPFQCIKWDKYIKILGIEKMHKLFELMRAEKHTCNSPYYYMLHALAWKGLLTGMDRNRLWAITGLSDSSMRRFFSEYATAALQPQIHFNLQPAA